MSFPYQFTATPALLFSADYNPGADEQFTNFDAIWNFLNDGYQKLIDMSEMAPVGVGSNSSGTAALSIQDVTTQLAPYLNDSGLTIGARASTNYCIFQGNRVWYETFELMQESGGDLVSVNVPLDGASEQGRLGIMLKIQRTQDP